MRLVDDLSGDILAGWAERQRLAGAARSGASARGATALRAYLRPMIAGQAPFPTLVTGGKPVVARTYISGVTGASLKQVDNLVTRQGLSGAAARRPGPCPMNVPVTGQIAGKPWRAALDYGEAPALMRHLGTAAFIVCAYLTGMRPGKSWACAPDAPPIPFQTRTGSPDGT
jgi:hypothetical protein